MWQSLQLWYASWTAFAESGQEYMTYNDNTLDRELLAGHPSLNDNKSRNQETSYSPLSSHTLQYP